MTAGRVTHVIGREGRLRANFHGLKFDPMSLAVFVNALVNGMHTAARPEKPSLWGKIGNIF